MMTDEQCNDIVEHATRTIIGDSQGISEAEMKRVVWLIAEIMTDARPDDA